MPRLVITSDTHMTEPLVVPDGDILIHCGDGTNYGTVQEVSRFNVVMSSFPHKDKIFVPGNHDWLFEREHRTAREIMTSCIVLIDSLHKAQGIWFYGSPWTDRPSRSRQLFVEYVEIVSKT